MSRIDQAWRRSSDEAAVGIATTSIYDPLAIDEYPSETAAAPGATSIAAVAHSSVAEPPAGGPVQIQGADNSAGRRLRHAFSRQSLQDQHRRLALRLQDAQQARGIKTVAVTSALPGDGKTDAVVSLALVLTEVYARRVLLIDADLHQPSLHYCLGIPNESGLCEALRGPRTVLSVTDVSPLFSVLTSGCPDPEPLVALASDRMRGMLDEFAERFDWVLLDTPPLSVLAEAPLLARRTHAAILVIAAATPLPTIERAMASLGRDRVVGTVLNGVET